MLERFTVDLIADEVSSHLRAGTPTSRLLHRFFRKGRRDGKRGHDHVSVALLLRESVNLASTDLCGEYLARRNDMLLEIAQCDARTGQRPSPSAGGQSPEPDSVDRTEPQPPLPSLPAHASDGDVLLRDALVRRRALAVRRRTRKLAINAEAKAVALRREKEEAERLAAEARQRRQELLQDLHELRIAYLERFNAIAYAGSLLWARYANGFEGGHSARRSRGSTVRPPKAGLCFDIPSVLADANDPDGAGLSQAFVANGG